MEEYDSINVKQIKTSETINEWDKKLQIVDQKQKINILSKQQIIIVKQQVEIIKTLNLLKQFHENESMCMFKCTIS